MRMADFRFSRLPLSWLCDLAPHCKRTALPNSFAWRTRGILVGAERMCQHVRSALLNSLTQYSPQNMQGPSSKDPDDGNTAFRLRVNASMSQVSRQDR